MSFRPKQKPSKKQYTSHSKDFKQSKQNEQTNIIQSKALEQNLYAQLIQQIKQYILQLQKLQLSQQEQPQSTIQKQVAQKHSLSLQNKEDKVKIQSNKIVLSPQQKIDVLKRRLQLLGNKMGYTPARLDNLEKIFLHYCNYIFKAGRHVTFDRIQYEKSHLIMERYFAFIHDFHLNKIVVNFQQKQLISKQDLILIFKRASASARNLQFPQFISVIQRLAVFHYDCQQNYEERMKKLKGDRRKVKDVNQKRKKQKQRRQMQKQQILKMQFQKQQQQSIQTTNVEQKPNEQQKQKIDLEKFKLDMFKKKSKAKKGKASNNNSKSVSPSKNNQQQNNQQQNTSPNNDELINNMMQDQNIQNPNKQFDKLNNYNQQKQQINDVKDNSIKIKNLDELMQLSKEEKVQLFLQLIEIDSLMAIQNKLRKFQNPLYKQLGQSQKSNNLLSSSKLRQNQLQNILRLDQLKQRIKQRQKERLKSSILKSISVQKYQSKKKSFHQRYMKRALNDWDAQHQKQRASYRKKDDGLQLSLEMLNNSSADKLKMKDNPIRFLVPEQDDNIFLDEYGGFDKKLRRSISSFSKPQNKGSPKNNDKMLDNLKRRAEQLQQVQKKYQQHKLSRFALQMYKNQHYVKKFLQKKW